MAENMSPNPVEYLCGTRGDSGRLLRWPAGPKVIAKPRCFLLSQEHPLGDGRIGGAGPRRAKARNHIYTGSTENRGWEWLRLEPPVNFTDEFTVGWQKLTEISRRCPKTRFPAAKTQHSPWHSSLFSDSASQLLTLLPAPFRPKAACLGSDLLRPFRQGRPKARRCVPQAFRVNGKSWLMLDPGTGVNCPNNWQIDVHRCPSPQI